jgi:hypothetical protein
MRAYGDDSGSLLVGGLQDAIGRISQSRRRLDLEPLRFEDRRAGFQVNVVLFGNKTAQRFFAFDLSTGKNGVGTRGTGACTVKRWTSKRPAGKDQPSNRNASSEASEPSVVARILRTPSPGNPVRAGGTAAPGVDSSPRTTSTEHPATSVTRADTLPIRKRSSPV